MTSYEAPLEDLRFVFEQMGMLDSVNRLAGLGEATPDLVGAILEEADKLARERLDPFNQAADKSGGARDENGVVHFSDRPVEGAERIQLPSEGRRPRPAVTPMAAVATVSPTAGQAEEPPQAFGYDSLEIVAPAPEETLWNIEGVLNVALRLRPALRQGDQIRVYFDGDERMTTTSTSFTIDEVYRGVHNIQAEVIDSTGRLMVRSLTNRFYVQQNSIARPGGPAPSPR